MVSIGSIKHEGMAALCQEGPSSSSIQKEKGMALKKMKGT
jgi:hypothetical protein